MGHSYVKYCEKKNKIVEEEFEDTKGAIRICKSKIPKGGNQNL